jgi:hypothetical protein
LAGSYSSSTYLNGAKGIFVSGSYAYVASNVGDSLTIIDVSDPSNPSYVDDYTNIPRLGNANSVYVSGKYAYVTSADVDGFSVFDVSDPSDIVYVSNYSNSTHLANADSIQVSGKYAYIANYNSNELVVIDVSDPSSPSFVGDYTHATYLNKAYSVFVSGKYAYVACELGDRLTILDISGIDAPAANIGDLQTSHLSVTENANVHNNLYVDNALNVGPGGVYIDGDSYAATRSGGSPDIAEWIKTNDQLEAGDVVVIDLENPEKVKKSSKSYDTTVAGIVSTKPHMVIGEEYKGDDAIRLALTGRVPVKVTTENGPIQIGDLLTTSSTPGYAMKCPIDTPEQKLQCMGAILGKALEPLESGEGKIIALVTLQ